MAYFSRYRSTPPLARGRMQVSNLVLATHPRPSFATPVPRVCLQTNKGRRSAERRDCLGAASAMRRASSRTRSPSGAPPRFSPKFPSARPGPRFLESPGANGRTLPGASAVSSSQSGHAPDERGPGRPAANRIVPPAGTAPAPRSGVPREHVPYMSEMLAPISNERGASRTRSNTDSVRALKLLKP